MATRGAEEGGSRVGGRVGVGEEGRGGACTAWASLQRPPAGGHGQRRCCANRGERWGVADAVRGRLTSGAGRQQGPGSQWRGAGEREREQGSTAMGH
jgi:hypothetical protein